MSTDTKLRKTQLFIIIQSDGFVEVLFGKLACPLMKVFVRLAKNDFSSINYYEFQNNRCFFSNGVSGSGVVRAGKGITLVISNEDMSDIIRITKSLENPGALIDNVR